MYKPYSRCRGPGRRTAPLRRPAEKTRPLPCPAPCPAAGTSASASSPAFTDANPNYEVTMLPGNSTSNVIQLQQKKADCPSACTP
ncbi:MAG: hypothetical protein ACLUPV_08035 [Bilophila wadsworthia]